MLTGAALMVAALGIAFWAFPKTDLIVEARESSTGVIARKIVETFSDMIPPQITELYGVSSKKGPPQQKGKNFQQPPSNDLKRKENAPKKDPKVNPKKKD